MKKIFLLMTIMTSLFFALSINSDAYTFNGSYDFSNIDLDLSINELNGASLNNLFDNDYLETIPLIEWNGYRNKFELDGNVVVFNEYIYIDLGYKNLFDKTRLEDTQFRTSTLNVLNNGIEIIASTTQSYTSKTFYYNLIENETYNISYDSTTTGQSGGTLEIRDFYNNTLLGVGSLGSSSTSFNTISNKIKLTFNVNSTVVEINTVVFDNIQLEYGNLETDFKPFGVLSEIYRLNTTPIVNNDMIQALYFYNLENINIDLLNYYFAVFLLNKFNLPIGDLWEYAWGAGFDSGYNSGYDDGYDDGYHDGQEDGYDEGYGYGQEDGYDTGYLDGNVEGLETGYFNGYNDGFDEGVISNVDTQWLLGFVTGTVNVLGVSIIPGISLGVFVFIPLFLGFIGFIFRLGGRRG